MILSALVAALGVGLPTSGMAMVLGAADSSADAVLYGVPAAAVAGFLSMVYKLLWNALDAERKARDADRIAHAAELARMNADAIERAERISVLLADVNRLLPTLLEQVKSITKLQQTRSRAPARKASTR
jgi:hypothetical protein